MAFVNLNHQIIDYLSNLSVNNGEKTVACIEWIDPLMAAGNWVPELVEIAKGINLFGKKGIRINAIAPGNI